MVVLLFIAYVGLVLLVIVAVMGLVSTTPVAPGAGLQPLPEMVGPAAYTAVENIRTVMNIVI